MKDIDLLVLAVMLLVTVAFVPVIDRFYDLEVQMNQREARLASLGKQ